MKLESFILYLQDYSKIYGKQSNLNPNTTESLNRQRDGHNETISVMRRELLNPKKGYKVFVLRSNIKCLLVFTFQLYYIVIRFIHQYLKIHQQIFSALISNYR